MPLSYRRAKALLARNGATKEEIKKYVEQEFHYDLSRSLDEIRPYYHHVESCQQTVPEAITAFLEAEDFLRSSRSLGSVIFGGRPSGAQ